MKNTITPFTTLYECTIIRPLQHRGIQFLHEQEAASFTFLAPVLPPSLFPDGFATGYFNQLDEK